MSATYNAVYTKPGATFADVLEAKANKKKNIKINRASSVLRKRENKVADQSRYDYD
jgi:hypothetical protein